MPQKMKTHPVESTQGETSKLTNPHAPQLIPPSSQYEEPMCRTSPDLSQQKAKRMSGDREPTVWSVQTVYAKTSPHLFRAVLCFRWNLVSNESSSIPDFDPFFSKFSSFWRDKRRTKCNHRTTQLIDTGARGGMQDAPSLAP